MRGNLSLSLCLSVFICLSLYLSVFLRLSLRLYLYLFIFLSFCLSVSLSLCLSVSLSLCLYVSMSFYVFLSLYLPVSLSFCDLWKYLSIRSIFIFNLHSDDGSSIFDEKFREPSKKLVKELVDVDHELGVVGSKPDIRILLQQPERQSSHVSLLKQS